MRIAGARNVEVEVGRRRGECPASAATPMASPQLPPSTVAERTRPRIPPWNTWRRWGGGRGAQASPGVEQNQAEGMAGMRLRGATQVQAEATCQAVPLRTPAYLAAPAPPWAAAPKAKAKLALTRLCPVMWALPTQNPSSQGVWEGAGVYGGRVSSSTRGPSERARLSNLISTARCGTLVLCARTAPAAAPLPAPHFRHCHPSLRFSSFCCKTG